MPLGSKKKKQERERERKTDYTGRSMKRKHPLAGFPKGGEKQTRAAALLSYFRSFWGVVRLSAFDRLCSHSGVPSLTSAILRLMSSPVICILHPHRAPIWLTGLL